MESHKGLADKIAATKKKTTLSSERRIGFIAQEK